MNKVAQGRFVGFRYPKFPSGQSRKINELSRRLRLGKRFDLKTRLRHPTDNSPRNTYQVHVFRPSMPFGQMPDHLLFLNVIHNNHSSAPFAADFL